jgi:hypothetical protein
VRHYWLWPDRYRAREYLRVLERSLLLFYAVSGRSGWLPRQNMGSSADYGRTGGDDVDNSASRWPDQRSQAFYFVPLLLRLRVRQEG